MSVVACVAVVDGWMAVVVGRMVVVACGCCCCRWPSLLVWLLVLDRMAVVACVAVVDGWMECGRRCVVACVAVVDGWMAVVVGRMPSLLVWLLLTVDDVCCCL